MTNNKNKPGDGKKQSRLTKFHTKVVSPIALRSKAFVINRARPFTPVVVWIQTHPRVFVLCSLFIPTWWFKLIFFSVSSENELEVNFALWILLFLIASVFSLKKLNSALYKSLPGDIIDPSEPQAMATFGDASDVEIVDGVDGAFTDIALDVANKLATLGFRFNSLGYCKIAGTSDKFNPREFCTVNIHKVSYP